MQPGSQPRAFDLDRLRIAPNICYESVVPQVIRRQVNRLAAEGRGPDVLINLTNDGWFFGSNELDLHMICGVFRAVECRKPFLIAANTGISAWIDGDGRIREQGPRRATGTILAEVVRDRRASLYLWWGDLPAGICLAACALCAVVGLVDRYRRPEPGGRRSSPSLLQLPTMRYFEALEPRLYFDQELPCRAARVLTDSNRNRRDAGG